ncbi:MAG: glycosyltransferase [Lachnospiraceae bacterium]|nr:glycosyltransferase [Lachnospiraceae bacterium]
MISVIIPIYNTGKYLEKCIESVLNQTYTDLEVILVNDGSTDNSLDICREYEKKDPRVILISQENKGISAARNAALKAAKGDIFSMVDSDDYLEPEMFELMLDKMNEQDADIVACNYRKVYENPKDNPSCDEEESESVHVYDGKEAVKQLMEGKNATRLIVAHCKIYKKHLFEQVFYPEGKVHEDEFVTYLLIYKSKRVVFFEKKLYNYMQRQGSIMSEIANVKLSVFDKSDALYERVRYFEDGDEELFVLAVRRYLEEYLKVLRLYVRSKGRTSVGVSQMQQFQDRMQEYKQYLEKQTYKRLCHMYKDVRCDMWKRQMKNMAKKILKK